MHGTGCILCSFHMVFGGWTLPLQSTVEIVQSFADEAQLYLSIKHNCIWGPLFVFPLANALFSKKYILKNLFLVCFL